MSTKSQHSVSVAAARKLAHTGKTPPQMTGVTPRWLLRMLPWVHVSSGTYRVNRRKVILREPARLPVTVEDGQAVLTASQLHAVPFLAEASDDFLEQVAGRVRSVRVEAGETIVSEGEAGDEFYVVAQGTAEVTRISDAGIKLRIDILGEGQFFGEHALIGEGTRTATVSAVTPCILAVIDRAVFDELLEASPDLRQSLMEAVEQQRARDAHANDYGEIVSEVYAGDQAETVLPHSYVDYEEEPREYELNVVQTILHVNTRITDLYNDPIDQLTQQLRLTIESMREQQELECINNLDFGLLRNVTPGQRVKTRNGPPTPDDLDELLSKVWKEPSFFLAHPRAIAAFGRECTRRGVPPATVPLGSSQILTWRGIPIVPSDKLLVNGRTRPVGRSGSSNILLVRAGEHNGGVVGLHQAGIAGEHMPSLTVRLMGIDSQANAQYLMTLYFSVAALTDDALGCLEDVEVGNFYAYD